MCLFVNKQTNKPEISSSCLIISCRASANKRRVSSRLSSRDRKNASSASAARADQQSELAASGARRWVCTRQRTHEDQLTAVTSIHAEVKCISVWLNIVFCSAGRRTCVYARGLVCVCVEAIGTASARQVPNRGACFGFPTTFTLCMVYKNNAPFGDQRCNPLGCARARM